MKTMSSLVKSIKSGIKKSWKAIAVCIVIVGVCEMILFNHYRKFGINQSYGRGDFVYLAESRILDWKLLARGPDTSPTKVGILAIDEKSLTQFGRWPFSRRYYTQAFANIKKLGVKWIGFDAIWSEPEKTLLEDIMPDLTTLNGQNYGNVLSGIRDLTKVSPGDRIMSEGIKDFGNIVLGYFYFGNKLEAEANIQDKEKFPGLNLMLGSAISSLILPSAKTVNDFPFISHGYGLVSNIPLQASASKYHAFFSNDGDADAINRWVTLVANIDGNLMPSLSLKTAAEYLNREIVVFFGDTGIESVGLMNREKEDDVIEIPIDSMGAGRLLVNPRGGSQSFHHYSLADAYNNTFSKEEVKSLKNSLLLLGATATGINDMRPNPFDPTIDGVENHAAAIDNIFKQSYFKRPAKIFKMEMIIVFAVGLFFSPLMIWGRAMFSGIAVIAYLAAYFFVDQYFWFGKGTWVFMGIPYIEILAMFLLTMLIKYMGEEKDKQFLKSAFGSYISPELIDEMYSSGEPPKLGGTSGIITAYFTDIAGFSSFSEKLTATKLVELLNEYLTAMTDILLAEKGTLDKYEGDAIIAFFGAPMTLLDHAVRACTVAVKMQEALTVLRKKWADEGDKWPEIVKEMRMRIGINAGEIVTGNMGSKGRMNYTMMGDSVNLAARLEAAAKQYGIFTHVSKFAHDLTEDKFEMRELDTIRVVGKSEPVTSFDLLGIKGQTSEVLLNLKNSFHEGLALYKAMKWDEALAAFKKAAEFEYQRFPEFKGKKTNPSEIYLKRCEEFKKNPPPDNWDRVYTLTEK